MANEECAERITKNTINDIANNINSWIGNLSIVEFASQNRNGKIIKIIEETCHAKKSKFPNNFVEKY